MSRAARDLEIAQSIVPEFHRRLKYALKHPSILGDRVDVDLFGRVCEFPDLATLADPITGLTPLMLSVRWVRITEIRC